MSRYDFIGCFGTKFSINVNTTPLHHHMYVVFNKNYTSLWHNDEAIITTIVCISIDRSITNGTFLAITSYKATMYGAALDRGASIVYKRAVRTYADSVLQCDTEPRIMVAPVLATIINQNATRDEAWFIILKTHIIARITHDRIFTELLRGVPTLFMNPVARAPSPRILNGLLTRGLLGIVRQVAHNKYEAMLTAE